MPSPMNHAERCIFLIEQKTPDDMGSHTTEGWLEGDEFLCLIGKASSLDRFMAGQQSNTGLFNITVDKSLIIPFDSVFRSKKTGRTYRVTQDPDDNPIPDMASFQVKAGQAESYVLPVG